MNKSFKRLLGILMVLPLLNGCFDFSMERWSSWIRGYRELEFIDLKYVSSDSTSFYIVGNYLSNNWCCFISGTEEEKEMYNQLCKKHNDVSYNRIRTLRVDEYLFYFYYDCDFYGISVTSDEDFDANHPAGGDLSDIVRFMSLSPSKFILGGYSSCFRYVKDRMSNAYDDIMRTCLDPSYFDEASFSTCFPIDKLIVEMTADDLVLLGTGRDFLGAIYFEKKPDIKGKHHITVSMDADNGRTYSGTIEINF